MSNQDIKRPVNFEDKIKDAFSEWGTRSPNGEVMLALMKGKVYSSGKSGADLYPALKDLGGILLSADFLSAWRGGARRTGGYTPSITGKGTDILAQTPEARALFEDLTNPDNAAKYMRAYMQEEITRGLGFPAVAEPQSNRPGR